MTQAQLLNDLGGILTQVLFWVSLAFVAGVSVFWPWWETDLGWTVILKTLCIAGLLLSYNLQVLFGINTNTLTWRWINLTLFAGIIGIIVWRGIVLWIIQRYNPPATKSGRAEYGKARARWKLRKLG